MELRSGVSYSCRDEGYYLTYVEAIKEIQLCWLIDYYKWVLQGDNDRSKAF